LGIREAVKDESQQAYLLGENFFDGSPQLQGDSLDATMNYAGFTKPVLYWLSRFAVDQHGEPHHVAFMVPWPTQALVDSWQSYRAAIPWEIATQQFNLLGSHDTARILSLVAGNPARNRLAVALLMTYVGVPCIYYGDEIGMRAEDSLQARNCIIWDPSLWDSELRTFYQTLVKLRRTSPALIEGGFQVLLVEEDTVAYMRDAEEEQIILAGNRGPGTRPAGPLPVADAAIPDGTEFQELFTGQRLTILSGGLPLPALFPGVQVWRTIGV
jgi:alpha-glucosidase